MSFIKKMLLPAAVLSVLPAVANAAENLAQDDFVGISFWLISMALVASTAFFFLKQPAWLLSGRHHWLYQVS